MIFDNFRRLVEAVCDLVTVLNKLVQVQQDAGPALDRLNTLELSRHQFEAECAGTLLKAEGKLKAAANAEARERQLKKSYERELDPFDTDIEQGAEAPPVSGDHATPGEAEGMQPVHLGLAPNSKAYALRAKWS